MATYKKIDGRTPGGGAYCEIYFFDEVGNPADEEKAVRFVIRECTETGDLIAETWGFTENNQKTKN